MVGVESGMYFPRPAPKKKKWDYYSCIESALLSHVTEQTSSDLSSCLATGKPVRAPNYPGAAKRIIRVILTVTTTGAAKAQV